MILTKLAPKAGFMKDSTQYAASGTWWDGDKVRFRNGLAETIGGWQPLVTNPIKGSCRCLYQWSSLAGNSYLALGTNQKFYTESGSVYTDITPLRRVVSLGSNPFSTTNLSTTVTVTDTGHGASAGDYVIFAGATAFNGLSAGQLNTEFQIQAITGSNTYTILASSAATGTGAGGGAGAAASYQISIGLDTTSYGNGWGAAPWGSGTYNTARTTSIIGSRMRLWSASNFGEDLICNPRGGDIYYWTLQGGGRATSLSNMTGASYPPYQALEVLVSTADRHLIAFGCTDIGTGILDPLLIRWADTESAVNWFPTDTSASGDLRIPFGSTFVTAKQSKGEILVWTDTSLHSLQYVGAPYIFGINTLAVNTSILGPKAKAGLFDKVYWWGNGQFYVYDGQVKPLKCNVLSYVMGNLNQGQIDKVYAYVNSAFNEVGWLYPSTYSSENDSYVVYNYAEDLWHTGTLPRTAWIDAGLAQYPMATGTDGLLYYQEIGHDDQSQQPPLPIHSYIESGPIEISEGEQMMFASKLIPDITFKDSTDPAFITFTITPKRYPGSSPSPTSSGDVTRSVSVPVEAFTEKVDLRVRGRAVTIKISSNTTGVGWKLGVPRLECRTDGRR